MSRATAASLVKFFAVEKLFTVADAMEATGVGESDVRMWLYEFQRQGCADIIGKVPRKLKFGRSRKGIRMIQLWEWLV